MGLVKAPFVYLFKQKLNVMTPFEQAVQQAKEGQIQVPKVSTVNGTIPYFKYQLAVHKYNLSLMNKGIMSRGIKLKDLKQYYGLKGKTASECLPQFLQIMETYCNS